MEISCEPFVTYSDFCNLAFFSAFQFFNLLDWFLLTRWVNGMQRKSMMGKLEKLLSDPYARVLCALQIQQWLNINMQFCRQTRKSWSDFSRYICFIFCVFIFSLCHEHDVFFIYCAFIFRFLRLYNRHMMFLSGHILRYGRVCHHNVVITDCKIWFSFLICILCTSRLSFYQTFCDRSK